jgi:quinoprotein glucose dehydrogenase
MFMFVTNAGTSPSAAPQEVSTPRRTIWDGVYVKEQADRGRAKYESACAYCHMDNLSGGGGDEPGAAPPSLKGPRFLARWRGQPIADLFGIISETMPKGRPSLVKESYAEIVSFILQVNGAAPGDTELPSEREKLQAITIVDKPLG